MLSLNILFFHIAFLTFSYTEKKTNNGSKVSYIYPIADDKDFFS